MLTCNGGQPGGHNIPIYVSYLSDMTHTLLLDTVTFYLICSCKRFE